jgi:hypothetical protein
MEGMIDLDAFDADDSPNDENFEQAEDISIEIDGASFDETDEDASNEDGNNEDIDDDEIDQKDGDGDES